MEPLEAVVQEIDSIERHLSRRTFIKLAAFVFVTPRLALGADDREFLRRVAATLIPAEAMAATGIDVLANIDYMLKNGSAGHRIRVMRFLSWSRRLSFLYGGDRVALNALGSRFVLVQKMGKALSSLCLAAFWADERAMRLIDIPE